MPCKILTTLGGCHSIRPSTISVESVGPSSRIVKAAPEHLYFSLILNLVAPIGRSFYRKVTPMRLTLRFLALFVLLVVATFPNSSSITTLAEEGNSPCMDGCIRGEQSCTGGCGYNQSCINNCRAEYDKCAKKCAYPLSE